MISAELKSKKFVDVNSLIDINKVAWGIFKCVDNEVPVGKTGRLRRSAHLIAGTAQLLPGEPEKHYSKKMSRYNVSLTYATPKSVGENANVFYTYGGRYFDYAPFVENKQHFLIRNINENIRSIMARAIKK